MKRHSDALAIQVGASNPSGIARSLLEGIEELRSSPEYRGTESIRQDPALRLIVHQLAFLFDIWEIDDSLFVYGELTDECKRIAAETGQWIPEGL